MTKAAVAKSSGNVFADLGLPDAEELQTKAHLALHIRRVVEDRGLTQVQTAKLLGLDQPKVSAIVNGRLDGFSIERLMHFLTDLSCDVRISVKDAKRGGKGQLVFG